MKRNVISFGDRSLNGAYGIVLSLGNTNANKSQIRYLASLGNVESVQTSFDKVKMMGNFVAEEARIGSMHIVGEVKLNGVCKGESIAVAGVLYASYLDCKVLRNDTVPNSNTGRSINQSWSGVFYAQTFENHGPLNLNFEYHFKNIISSSDLYSSREIECERFYSFSKLQTEAVNADYIFLLTAELAEVKQLTGETVVIKRSFHPDQRFHNLPKDTSYRKRSVDGRIAEAVVIEADRIDIEYTKSALISGKDVSIGDLCIIDRVEYSSSIEISKKAIVNEVVKL
jgi:hypothetical protein